MHEDNKIPFLLTIPLAILCIVLFIMLRIRDVHIRWMREDQAELNRQLKLAHENWDGWHTISEQWRQNATEWKRYAEICEKREQGLVGTTLEIKNRCFTCYYNVLDAAVARRALSGCENPLENEDVKWCFAKYGQSSCSHENTTVCTDLLVCHSGRWEVHCDEASLLN